LKDIYALNKIDDREIRTAENTSFYRFQNDINTTDLIFNYLVCTGSCLYLLQTLAGSVSTFMNCCQLLGAVERALVILIFQFERRVEENGCAETDYGTNGVAVCNKFINRKKYD